MKVITGAALLTLGLVMLSTLVRSAILAAAWRLLRAVRQE